MNTLRRLLSAGALLSSLCTQAVAAPPSAAALDQFEKKVRPLLAEKCWKCHGEGKQKGGLRLDSAAGLAHGGSTGPVISPGEPERSLLIQAVEQTGDVEMPPDGKLSEQQIADLIAWIKAGAVWPGAAPHQKGGNDFTAEQKAFWAFQPVKQVKVPVVKNAAWPTSPIDHFILAKLEEKSLAPAPRADNRTLLRRVTFDLTGLPPTAAELDAFQKDTSADAFAKVVDRLLASPHYGERWGRHWLDVVRYSETTANDGNCVMRYAWRYRDYVVAALNRDKPYDQFITEQLAGDLLPATTNLSQMAERVVATGMLMVGPKALAEKDKEQTRLDIVDDQLDVIGRGILGLTLGCARCHNHKFDPILTSDYYSLAGILRSTEVYRGGIQEWPLLELPGDQAVVVMAPKEGKTVDLPIHIRGNHFQLGALAPRGFPRI
ncbi:MAG TPA: DUF1549 domain-containing protein [Pirellulales bacterium]|nr:DUF1549 domain-containing protein [Pirellulales bacterium]